MATRRHDARQLVGRMMKGLHGYGTDASHAIPAMVRQIMWLEAVPAPTSACVRHLRRIASPVCMV